MIKLEWAGGKEMLDRLKKIAAAHEEDMKAALYQEAQAILAEAKRRTPVLPTRAQFKAMGRSYPKGAIAGALRASGRVLPVEKRGKDYVATIAFGGAAIDYAVVQHERLDFHHVNGRSKYLESALNEARPDLARRLADRLKAMAEARQ